MTEKICNLPNKPINILRRKQVEIRTGLSRSTIYELISAGTFPRQVNLCNGRAVGWIEQEINNWLQDRIDASR